LKFLSIIAKIVKITKYVHVARTGKKLEHVKNLEGKISLKEATCRTLRQLKKNLKY